MTTVAVGCAATTSTWLALAIALRTEGRVLITGELLVQLLIVAAMAVVLLGSTLTMAEDPRGRLCTVGLLTAAAGSFAAALTSNRGGLLIAALVVTIGATAVVAAITTGAVHRARVGLVAVLGSQALALVIVVLAVTAAPTVGSGPVLLGSGAACALAAIVERLRPTSTPPVQRGEPPWNRRTLRMLAGGWLCCAGLHTACAHLLGTVLVAWVLGTWSLAAVVLWLALRYSGQHSAASAGALACLALGVGVLISVLVPARGLTVSAVLVGVGLCVVASGPPKRWWREDELPSNRPPVPLEPIVPWPLR